MHFFFFFFLQLQGPKPKCELFLTVHKSWVPERELASALASTQPTLCRAKGWSGNFHPAIQPGLPFPLPPN